MKYLTNNNLFPMLLAALLLSSCGDIYDNINDFSPKEVVYPAKFDSIGWKLGFERVEFDLKKGGRVPESDMHLGKARKTVIEYDDKKEIIDSVCSWVSISGLTEARIYRFSIYTEDQYGNKSIPQTAQVTPYTQADLDALSLVPPIVTESTSAAMIEWSAPIESELYDLFSYRYEYIDKDGQKHEGGEDSNLPSFLVENVRTGVEVPITITARVLPKVGGEEILDTVYANLVYDLRISDAANPAIFLKMPLPAVVIDIRTSEFPIEFSWAKVPEANGYLLKASRNRDFPAASTQFIDVGDVNSYLLTRETAMRELFPDFDRANPNTTYYWQIAPKEQTAPVRLQSRSINYYRLFPVLQQSITTSMYEATRVTLTNHDGYQGYVQTGNDPYLYTQGLPIAVNTSDIYKVMFRFDYQSNKISNEGQIFYAKPGAAGGVSTDMNLVFPSRGIDIADESKWINYEFDCVTAIKTHQWGAVGHRLRLDFVQEYPDAYRLFSRNMRYDLYVLEDVEDAEE
ncbi:MAG: DUF4998 domain-containing protein [Tannerella sp.]|jgi:hypothetical protein|nr:DUF4998 domain-containing protein [Tannerella sp.]